MKWKYQDTQFVLPNEGEENRIKRKHSNKCLGFKKKKNGQFGKKLFLLDYESTGYQEWQRSQADSEGWFTLRNTKLGSLLTAETSRITKVAGMLNSLPTFF